MLTGLAPSRTVALAWRVMSRTTLVATMAIAAAAMAPAPAQADTTAEAVGEVAIGSVQRVRRAFVVGPHVGGFGGIDVDRGDPLHGVTFGLALYAFKITTVLDLRQVVVDTVRQRVRQRVADIVAAGGTAPTDLADLTREVAAEVKAEVAGRPPPRRTLERPRFGAVLEGAIRTSPGGGFQTRLVVSRGVGRASVGVALAVQRASGATDVVPGLEASLRLTPLGQAWTPVAELYLRGDVAIADRLPVALIAGARATLDLF